MTTASVTDTQIVAAQGGDQDAMWEIISAYEPMLRSAVRSAAPAAGPDDVEDLLQEARAVLIQHVHRYESSSSSAQLYTYAHRAVRRAVAEEWTRTSSALTVDPSIVLRVKHALWESSGSIDEAWESINAGVESGNIVSRERFMSAIDALMGAESLEAPLADDADGATLADTIPDASSDFTSATERRDLARYLLDSIAPRQAFALRSYYGIQMQRQEDSATGFALGVTPAQVRLLRSRGVARAQEIAKFRNIAA
ncbi:sigma-70 family RNA polymerase sigma factor [Streptomyces sp. NPDC091376]|uniref:sigma-70 family RNA polymerase sigma factor n=1 Tax=Streptomyces sp. NPDC091376 TaxID=3365994 RepID=UPI0037F35BFE